MPGGPPLRVWPGSAEQVRDMDVKSASQRMARMATLGVGTAAGLVFALPVDTRSVACPPAREGRAYCLVQHAWAPALVEIAGSILVAWMIGEFLCNHLPELRIRWKDGQRLVRRATDHGREAVLADPVLLGANRGVLPEPGRETRWVKRAEPAADEPMTEPEPVPAPALVPAATSFSQAARRDPNELHALGHGERMARPGATLTGRLRILDAEDTRTRPLRREGDPALVVSCWSDLTAARELPDRIATPA